MQKLLFILLVSFLTTSCVFTENITVNPDGTGQYVLDMDGSSLMAMIPNDSLGRKKEKSIDSTFSFKKIFEEKKDSIAKLPREEQDKLKKLENFNMRMKMNYDSKEFLFSMNTNFNSVAELQNVMDDLSEIQKMGKGQSLGNNSMGGMNFFGKSDAKVKYFYDGIKFTRRAIVDKKALKALQTGDEKKLQMFFESSKYVLKYHFPKAVKSISNKTALFSEDRKTVTIEYTFDEFMKTPEKLNFEVLFQ